jgi:GntR family transcriptional repressor for pyruvate dehydrogenase complex
MLRACWNSGREVESGTCAIAAQKATEEDIKGIKANAEKNAGFAERFGRTASADLEFHYMIARISRNSLIKKTYEIINDIYAVQMKRIVKSMGRRNRCLLP